MLTIKRNINIFLIEPFFLSKIDLEVVVKSDNGFYF